MDKEILEFLNRFQRLRFDLDKVRDSKYSIKQKKAACSRLKAEYGYLSSVYFDNYDSLIDIEEQEKSSQIQACGYGYNLFESSSFLSFGMMIDGIISELEREGKLFSVSSKAGRKQSDSGMKIDSLKADGRVIDSLKHLVDKVHEKGHSYEYSTIICALKMKGAPLCYNSKKDIAHAIKNYLNDDSLNVETMCSKNNTTEPKITKMYGQLSAKLQKTDK